MLENYIGKLTKKREEFDELVEEQRHILEIVKVSGSWKEKPPSVAACTCTHIARRGHGGGGGQMRRRARAIRNRERGNRRPRTSGSDSVRKSSSPACLEKGLYVRKGKMYCMYVEFKVVYVYCCIVVACVSNGLAI
jgi:hypothetical protein